MDAARDFVGNQRRPQIAAQIERRCGFSAPQNDRGGDVLPQPRMRYGKSGGLGNRRMIHEHLIDLEGRDLLAAAVDEFLGPADDREKAVGVDAAQIAGAEPAIGESGAVRLGVVDVAGGHARTLHHDLAHLAGSENPAVIGPDRDIAGPWFSDGAALSPLRIRRIGRDLPGFADAVGVEDRNLEECTQPVEYRVGKQRAAGIDEAQRMPEARLPPRQGAFQDRAMQGRAGGIPGHPQIGEPGEEVGAGGSRRASQAAAEDERHEQRGFQSLGVVKRCDAKHAVARR